VIKFVSDLRQVSGFLRFPPPITLTSTTKPNHTFFIFSEAEIIIGSKGQPVVVQEADISMADLHR